MASCNEVSPLLYVCDWGLERAGWKRANAKDKEANGRFVQRCQWGLIEVRVNNEATWRAAPTGMHPYGLYKLNQPKLVQVYCNYYL